MSHNKDIDKPHDRKILIAGCGGMGNTHHISKLIKLIEESESEKSLDESNREREILYNLLCSRLVISPNVIRLMVDNLSPDEITKGIEKINKDLKNKGE